MKTRTSTFLVGCLLSGSLALAEPKIPAAQLLDMYAVTDGDSFIVHILANGEITEFVSDRKTSGESYKLTLDVPALSPLDTRYDVATPFSRNFQVWPMQLEGKIYSRIEIELDIETSSVVGMENASHLFIRIQKPLAEAQEAIAAEAPTPELGVLPAGTPSPSESDSDDVLEVRNESEEDELFFDLFPTPAREGSVLFNVAAEELDGEEILEGIRLGRFSIQPSMDASWIHGTNLLLQNDETFVDDALLVRGRVAATLLDSGHDVKLVYEGRYRDFGEFDLEEKYTNVFDVETAFQTSPSSMAKLSNHFVRGTFESHEFDPGGEIVASPDLFYRNLTQGVFGFDLSERLGAEVSASHNRVEMLEEQPTFFSYATTTFGATFLYDLTPLRSLFGEYGRAVTPEPPHRPQAGSRAELLLFGIRGELTPLLRGQVRAGYASQSFDGASVPQSYRGFVADVRLTRDFGEKSALDVSVGRRTNPSAYEENGFYVSNYARARFVAPLSQRLRLTATGSLFRNGYSLPSSSPELRREDTAFSIASGLAYFFSPRFFAGVDYRYDRRSSIVEEFQYRNNAIQVQVGYGLLSR